MSLFGTAGTIRSRSVGRAVMLIGVVLAALIWAGLLPPFSGWARALDEKLQDRISLMLEPTKEREDLVFLGIDTECRKQTGIDLAVVRNSRALSLMRREGGNERLDRRVYAELIEKLAAAGARAIIFDVLFVGSSGSEEADREFAEALHRHHDRVILAVMLRPSGDGRYEALSSVEQIPMRSGRPDQLPREGYVNLWPDSVDGVVRRVVYEASLSELETGERGASDRVYGSLSAVAGSMLGVNVPAMDSPRLRYAVSAGENPSFALAYAPRSLHTVFVPEKWRTAYTGGEFFRDKVVLVSTSTREDGDHYPIPGAVIHGGQYHLQALGSLLQDGFWRPVPPWANIAALLVMAGLAVAVGIAVRHPLAIFLTSLALGGGFLMVCAVISSLTGMLFAGTAGLIGLVTVTLCAEAGQLIARRGTVKCEAAQSVPAMQ